MAASLTAVASFILVLAYTTLALHATAQDVPADDRVDGADTNASGTNASVPSLPMPPAHPVAPRSTVVDPDPRTLRRPALGYERDPNADHVAGFMRTLRGEDDSGRSGVAAGTRRRVALERARRLAPFDLDWGLR
ncbi:MAG: hypothetical protein AB7S26_25705 [Sandaracinaceae bacterium]